MKIIVRDNLGKDVTHEREWYINTDGKIFYYTGDIDGPLYIVDNDYTWEVDQLQQACNTFEEKYNEWQREYLGKWIGIEQPKTDYPSCCDGCSNNPKNGGSGVCNCTLPYMQDPIKYTIQPGDSCMANNTGGYVYTISTKFPDASTQTANIADAIERIKKYVR